MENEVKVFKDTKFVDFEGIVSLIRGCGGDS